MKERIEQLLRQMTLEEKIGMIHGAGLFRTEGIPRLGIPPLVSSDGPMGVREQFADDAWVNVGCGADDVTYLPCNSALASTWNTQLAFSAGQVLGSEARGRGKDVILAPGINIKRSPLCGRNFEYMSEDPCLTAAMAAPMVQGIQTQDVSACPKHFAANNQETDRFWVDTVVGERALREIYLPAFQKVVEAGACSIMGAYNRLNGEHCSTGSILQRILREEWGFDGVVFSDWGAVHDTDLAANSALDIEMDVRSNFDEYYMAQPLEQKVRSGEIPESVIDEKVRNILRLMLRLKMLQPESEQRSSGSFNHPDHRKAALDVARQSVILLKNDAQLLPLDSKKVKKVAVIGSNAAVRHAHGGGSAEIRALYEISPLLGIKMLLGGNVEVVYAPGYLVPERCDADVNWQADSTTEPQQALHTAQVSEADRTAAVRQALDTAKTADAVIFVGGLNHDCDVEGQDRPSMRLPYGQDALLDELLELRPDTVVVMYAGSPVEMPWLHKAKALVWSYYNGMEGGTALAEVLFGQVNPSGKLAETMPVSEEQCLAHRLGQFGKSGKVEYTDGVLVGYRWYDTEQIPVNFCFGHGLSYTSFAYSDLEVQGGQVRVQVKNTGSRPGREIVQLYAGMKNSAVQRPVHELKGFASVELEPGEQKPVCLPLTPRDLARFDEESGEWVTDAGEYTIEVGASARDIRLCTVLTLEQ